jgi:hypothetical protein
MLLGELLLLLLRVGGRAAASKMLDPDPYQMNPDLKRWF